MYLRIRKDLLEEGTGVPVGNSYYSSAEPLWSRTPEDNEDITEVFYNGKWQEVSNIDWEDAGCVLPAELKEDILIAWNEAEEAYTSLKELYPDTNEILASVKERLMVVQNRLGKYITDEDVLNLQ